MYNLSNFTFLLLIFVTSVLTSVGCDSIREDSEIDVIQNDEYSLGWIASNESLTTVPLSGSFFNTTTLPRQVDLTPRIPPVGNQNPYGTCVSWALGYNLKSALSGIQRNLSTSQLASPDNQFSPKDLFLAIQDGDKGPNCGGTYFTSAFNLLQSRGVARMSTVPYTNLGNCSQSNVQSNWTNEAGSYKIEYWRKIDPSINSIKDNLANNIPVAFGAKLADNFISWRTNEVLTSNTTYLNVGQHAYHAMVVVGYDDNKGPGGAFKVVNSWGTGWGANGFIWVDYAFFINEFCQGEGGKPLFIAANKDANVRPPDDNPQPNQSGVDLAAWVFNDAPTSTWGTPGRRINLNIYNIGNQTAQPSANWSFYYIYYNAYNINDWGVIFYDRFNTTVAPNTYFCPQFANYCDFNFSIPPGNSFANRVFGNNEAERTYTMPPINGPYYLLLWADANDSFVETNEQNNLFYTTQNPIQFQNGFGLHTDGEDKTAKGDQPFVFLNLHPFNLAAMEFRTSVNANSPNSYTPAELRDLLNYAKRSGVLEQKLKDCDQRLSAEVHYIK